MKNDTNKQQGSNTQSDIGERYEHYVDSTYKIYIESTNRLINWLFILNTGGVITTMTYISTCEKIQGRCLLISVIFFVLGIIFVYISESIDKHQYGTRTDDVENAYMEFKYGDLDEKKLSDKLKDKDWKPSEKSDYLCDISAICFLIAVVIGIANI